MHAVTYELVKEALLKAGRADLIGFDEKCLIRPRQFANEKRGVTNHASKRKKAENNSRRKKR